MSLGARSTTTRPGDVATFAVVAVVLGTAYAFTMPPLQVADEKSHLFRAYGVSRGECIAAERTSLPTSLLRLEATFPPVLEKRKPVTDGEIWRWARVPLEAERTGTVTAAAANVYGCGPYLAAAAGLRLATAADLAPLWVIYCGRLANLAIYTCLTALALALLPGFRPILVALALMPMSLHQAASLSADAITIASAFLACAVAVRTALGGARDRGERPPLLALASSLLLAASCKTNAVLVGLALLLPRPPRCARLRHVLSVASVALPGILLAAVWVWLNQANLEIFRAAHLARGVDMTVNAHAALQSPMSFARSVIVSVTADLGVSLEQLVGVFGWATVRRPVWSTWLYGAVLLAAPLLGAGTASLRPFQRLVLAVTALLGVVSVYWGLWLISVAAATHGFPTTGVQIGGAAGRYLIPFAFPLLIACSTRVWPRAERPFAVVLLVVVALVNVVGLREVRRHYYTPRLLLVDAAAFDRTGNAVLAMREGERVSQTLRPRVAGLSRIDVDVATYGRRIAGGALRARLLAADGTVLVHQVFALRDVADGSYVSMKFEPLAGSRNADLRLELVVEALPPGDAFGLYVSAGAGDVYPAGALFRDGAPATGDLQFRSYRNG